MPSIKVSVPHNLGADEARRRISHLVSDAKQRFGGMVTDVQESWTGNHGSFAFRTMGMPISGSLDVEPASVLVEIDLPLAALPFKGRIESELTNRARALLT